MNVPAHVQVDFEYGTLEEIVVGIPHLFAAEWEKARGWAEEAMKVLPEAERRAMMSIYGKDAVQAGLAGPLEEENRSLLAILERRGVKVLRPEPLTREQVAANLGAEFAPFAGASQVFARDPFFVVGENVIECTMGSLHRRAELLGLAPLLGERLIGSNARWVHMPEPDWSRTIRSGRFDKTSYPALEGGDVIVLGKKVLVGTSANPATGSSELGVRWLAGYLGHQGYDVEQVRMGADFLHLDVAMSVPRPGVVVVCPEALTDGVPACFDGWTRIDVTRDDARHLATNGLPLDPDHYVLGTNDYFDGRSVADRLRELGVEVELIPFGRHTALGGSIRCSTMALRRKAA